MIHIVTIDGPCGAGKSTVARIVAERLDLNYFSSGMIFRCIAYKMIKENIKLDNKKKIIELINNLNIEIKDKAIYIDGIETKENLQTKEVTKKSIDIAVTKYIHNEILIKQREVFSKYNFVIEGRETGSVLFPNADIKIFLDSDVDIRAKRKYEQTKKFDNNLKYEEVLKELKDRDLKDYTQKGESCLKVCDDASYINASNLNINEVVNIILDIIRNTKQN